MRLAALLQAALFLAAFPSTIIAQLGRVDPSLIETHFKDIEFELESIEFAPPARAQVL